MIDPMNVSDIRSGCFNQLPDFLFGLKGVEHSTSCLEILACAVIRVYQTRVINVTDEIL